MYGGPSGPGQGAAFGNQNFQAGTYGEAGYAGPPGAGYGGPAGPGFGGPAGPAYGGPSGPGFGGPPQGGFSGPDGFAPNTFPLIGGPAGPGAGGFGGPGPSGPSSYGQPGYGAPQPGFGNPPPGYGAPIPGNNAGPPPNYGAGPNAGFAGPQGANRPANQFGTKPSAPGSLELKFKCQNLRNKDTFGKSDPYIQAELVSRGQKVQLGRTETVTNDLSPSFQTPISVPFNFEVPQELTVLVYDSDAMSEDDVIGRGVCMLSDIVANRTGAGHTITLGGRDGQGAGLVCITYEKVPITRTGYIFNISCSEVRDIEVFSS